MYDNYNYPVGADNINAPWNKEELEPEEIEVTVSITLSKTFKIKVDDYNIEECNKEKYYDYSNCNLREAVKNQIILPCKSYKYINGNTNVGKQAIKDLKGWDVDDFEVINENYK